MKKFQRLFAILAALMLLVAACGDSDSSSDDASDESGTDEAGESAAPDGEPIKIGVLTSLTGPFTSWGLHVEAGATMAAEDLNDAGGIDGRPVEVIVADHPVDL